MSTLEVRHTVFSVALLRRLQAQPGAVGAEYARTCSAMWLELKRAQAYRDALVTAAPAPVAITSDEPLTAKHAKLHKVA